MSRFFAVCALILFVPLMLSANEFDWLVREFSRQSGARQTYIPLFGLVRFSVAVVHPAGASQLRLAVFEHANLESKKFSQLTDAVVGQEWKPMIRVRSRNNESTNIYARQQGRDLRLLITSLDGGEATFVQVQMRPAQLIKFIDDHRRAEH
jgi:hypothetical protein